MTRDDKVDRLLKAQDQAVTRRHLLDAGEIRLRREPDSPPAEPPQNVDQERQKS